MELAGKTLAITGIGGFIGLRMLERARERGIQVRGIELDPRAGERASELGAEVVIGDVCDAQALERAFRGADFVFHTAAIVAEDGDWELYRRVNVDGTLNVGRVARRLGVQKLVHLSSVMVYGFDYPPDVDEAGPLRGEDNPYCQTKIESEQVALALHEPGRFEVVAIRPGDVYGPHCPSWVTRPIALMRQGLFALPNGGRGILNHVHVDNLLDAVFLAFERDVGGRAFNVTDGVPTPVSLFFGHYARMLGGVKLRSLPAPLMLTGFRVIERAAKKLGKKPPVSAAAVRFISRPHAYSIARARTELGYTPRISLAQGMSELERWLRAEGLV